MGGGWKRRVVAATASARDAPTCGLDSDALISGAGSARSLAAPGATPLRPAARAQPRDRSRPREPHPSWAPLGQRRSFDEPGKGWFRPSRLRRRPVRRHRPKRAEGRLE